MSEKMVKCEVDPLLQSERTQGFTADPVYGRANCLPMLGSLKTSRTSSSSRRVFLRNTTSGISDPICSEITTHLLWDVTGSFTCVVIFLAKSYFSEILVRMRSRAERECTSIRTHRERESSLLTTYWSEWDSYTYGIASVATRAREP